MEVERKSKDRKQELTRPLVSIRSDGKFLSGFHFQFLIDMTIGSQDYKALGGDPNIAAIKTKITIIRLSPITVYGENIERVIITARLHFLMPFRAYK